MEKKLLLALVLAGLIVISGCTGKKDISLVAESLPRVQKFLEEHPGADIKTVFLEQDYIQDEIDSIREQCGDQMQIQDYYKATVSAENINLTVWLDSEDYKVLCAIQKGNESDKEEPKKNCRELNGHLCDSADECALELLNSTDSYCCPIECGQCPEDVDCDDGNRCTEDKCVVREGEAKCLHEDIEPCPGNGICERGEIETCDPTSGSSGDVTGPELCCPKYSNAVIGQEVETEDCPDSCDDGNPNTADWYNFSAQECQHVDCESLE